MTIGHNGGPTHGPSFDSAIADLLSSGAVLAVKEWYDMAMIDKRLSHGHRVVMVEIATLICKSNSKEFPTQDHLVKRTGYTLMTLRRIIADLTKMGYLVSARRQIEAKKPAVAQYSLRRLSPEECQNAVVSYLMRERNRLQTIDKSQPKVGKLTGVPQVDGRLSNQAEYTNARIVGDTQLDKRQSSHKLTGVPQHTVKNPANTGVAKVSVRASGIDTNKDTIDINSTLSIESLPDSKDNSIFASLATSSVLGEKFPVQRAFDAFNVKAKELGLPVATKLSSTRASHIRARLREYGLDGWQKALDNISKNPYNLGHNKDGWRVHIDYFVKPDKFSMLHDMVARTPRPTQQQGIGRG
jgi:hypothetical protein